jgi:hypothetical protein
LELKPANISFDQAAAVPVAALTALQGLRDHGRIEHMLTVMTDERARTPDRMDAAKWLADRGFGKAAPVINAGVTPEHLLQDFLSKLSIEDQETMRAILTKYSPT